MDVVIDTHAFLWFANGDSQLSSTARELIADRTSTRYLSTASLWEVAIKVSIGKLTLTVPFDILVPAVVEANGLELLPISMAHASGVSKLGFPRRDHRDPFDRLIVSQCQVENLPLVSIDDKLDAYEIRREW